MNNRLLGTFGLLGAPSILVGVGLLPMLLPTLEKTSFWGLTGVFFMLSWMASMVGLLRLNATGNSAYGRFIIKANLATLTLANLYNVYEAIDPRADTILFRLLDLFWPVSMVVMLLAGIAVARAGVLRGWQRYVPLAVGLWLPFTVLVGKLVELTGNQVDVMLISGGYALVSWGLMAYIVMTSPQPLRTLTGTL